MIWKKTLLAAAVATACVQARAAEPAEAPEVRPTPSPSDKDKPQQMAPVRVEADTDEESLKAETQSSSSKLELSLRETPQSVSVITQESLRARQVVDFGQALELAAGVNQFSGTGPFGGLPTFGFNELTIRGIAIDSVHDVREDGFINTTYFAIPDMAIYERVDVVKGPSSVAYGRGSAGGIVNRIRKKPLAEARGEVSASIGSFDTYRADADFTGPLNDANSVRGRVVAAYSDEGSFVDGVQTNRILLAPSVDFDLTDTTRLLLEGLYQHEEFVPNTGMPLVPVGDNRYRAPDVRRSLFFGVPSRTDNEWDIYSGKLQLEQAIGDNWFATLRLNANKTKSPIHADRYAYGFDDGYTTMIRNDFAIDRDIWAGELQITGDLDIGGMPVKIAGGIEYTDNDYHRRGAYAYLGFANIYAEDFTALPDLPLEPGVEYTTRNKASSAYLQAQIRPVERLSVLIGLRYDDADAEYNSITNASISRKQDDDITGRIGVTYDVTDNISVYGMYGESFLPTIFDVGADGQILDPETGEIYEAGVKTEWLDQRLAINAAVYRIDRDKIPVSVPPTYAFAVSSGLQRSEGFELEINGQPLPGWNVSVAYNQLDSAFKDPDDPFFGATPGGTADWQVGLFSSYELQSGPLQGFGVGATVFAIDDRGVSTFSRGMLDGYERVDLNLFYKGLPSWEFALLVRNILDERYIEGADRPGAYAQFGSPTAALLTVRRSFGQR